MRAALGRSRSERMVSVHSLRAPTLLALSRPRASSRFASLRAELPLTTVCGERAGAPLPSDCGHAGGGLAAGKRGPDAVVQHQHNAAGVRAS
jgi:hypothetical protein